METLPRKVRLTYHYASAVIWILREEREDQGRSLLESLEVEQKLGPKGTRFLHGHNNLESTKKPVYSIPMNKFETNGRKKFYQCQN
jgi:hypothetical protein